MPTYACQAINRDGRRLSGARLEFHPSAHRLDLFNNALLLASTTLPPNDDDNRYEDQTYQFSNGWTCTVLTPQPQPDHRTLIELVWDVAIV
ncbi:hypothetical protein BASA81_006718 [Batrachochytrium salamandrivorans]|nr:hypothetical protein BASA81_006718 [Batrachochytrium salamandrivorans]